MEDCREFHTLYLDWREPQLFGNGHREFCNTFLMACCIGIPNLDHGCQGMNCFLMTGQDGVFILTQLFLIGDISNIALDRFLFIDIINVTEKLNVYGFAGFVLQRYIGITDITFCLQFQICCSCQIFIQNKPDFPKLFTYNFIKRESHKMSYIGIGIDDFAAIVVEYQNPFLCGFKQTPVLYLFIV